MSGKTGIIIQARMSSSRLPGKSLMKIGEHPLIWYVVRRAEILGLPVVVCTSTDPTDDPLCAYLEREEIDFYRGDLHNVLDRYIKAAEALGIENIIRVTGDNPLFDFKYLWESLDLFDRYSYVDGIYENGLIKGTGFELVTLKELSSHQITGRDEKEHVTLALRRKIAFLNSYKKLEVRENHKGFFNKIIVTCDYKEDLEVIRKIFSFYNYKVNITVGEIVKLYFFKQELFKTNSKLHSRII